MKVLIAYGTTEGQTGKIVEAIAEQVRGLSHEAVLFDTSSPRSDLEAGTFDRIIVAGSVHEERHQEAVEVFVLVHRADLNAKPTLFLSVSLAAAFEDKSADAQRYVDMFLERVNWRPATILLVAGAVRHAEYDYYREQILAHVVLEGRDLDAPEDDQEFTDWDALAKAVEAFMAA